MASSPVKITVGVNVSAGEAEPVYRFIMSIAALCGIYGTIFTFLTACTDILRFTPAVAIISVFASWQVFSFAFGIWDKKPALSKTLLSAATLVIFLYVLLNRDTVTAGYMFAVNDFMGGLFKKFAENPIFVPDEIYEEIRQKCLDSALAVTVSLVSIIVCVSVKKPNIILFLIATVPLPEVCLYFGLEPDAVPFALLAAAQFGAAAAELVRLTVWSPRTERLCVKAAAQSALCGIAAMLVCFLGARIYMRATDYTRPDKADEFRDSFSVYMKNFSWQKLSDDVNDALIPVKNNDVTHDGRLGNTAKVEFTGESKLEVTLPSDAAELYLKGYTAVDYTGSRWNEGPALPQLDTKLTSADFFSGRVLKYISGFEDLELMDVIVRTSDTSDTGKYLPSNSAGLLETDGIRRRFGVYFPQNRSYYNNGEYIINGSDKISLPDDMVTDEQRLRSYAYEYCLDVPDTFTAAEEFFSDFEGGGTWDTLAFIRKKLRDTCEYDLEAGKKPFGADFAQWFLTENKKGSCTHFATAAALLCRYMGIPARYCEGYVIKGSDIAAFPSEGRYTTVAVPDSRAHAWVEIYADGFGWVIFETTPGYGNMIYSEDSDDYANPVQSSEITSVTTEPPVFTENPDLTAESETAQMITGTETEVSVSQNSDLQASDVSEETSDSVSSNESGSDGGSNTSGANGTNGTGEGGGMSADGNNAGNNSNGAEKNGGNDSDLDDNQDSGYSAESEYDANGAGVETESPDESRETTETASASEQITETEHKPMPRAVKILLTVLIWAAVIIGAVFLLRYFEAVRRKKLAMRCPEKAAAEIYRMLARLAAMHGIKVSAEDLPARIKDDFGAECDAAVLAALKARFGEGGSVTREDITLAEKQYAQAAGKLISGLSAWNTFLARLFILDRYE